MKSDDTTRGRVVELHGQRIRIFAQDQYLSSIVKGKLKYGDRDKSPIAVGDYVYFIPGPDGTATIDSIEPRKTVLSKPSVEREGLLQIIASNIDKMFIVVSVKNPKFKPGLVDRFLVTAFREGIQPVVVINKIDLQAPDIFSDYYRGWQNISCKILFTSAKTGAGVDGLKELMLNGTSVIAGHSGVGKSSLLNIILPELGLKTMAVSNSTDRGVHTTSRVSLYRIAPDGWVADTPGLKVMGLAGVDKSTLHYYYPEFESLKPNCRFDDCIHINEPNCAVKKSVEEEDGAVSAFRYESYLRIYSDLEKPSNIPNR